MPSPPRRTLRFTFIVILVAVGTLLAAVGGWRYARASAPINGPIIIISIDTLRADHLPAYGYRKVRTPAIDALAADGVVFDRAYSHAPQTLPAHASLLSGRLPFETGVRDNVGFTIKKGERLLPQMLRERGYTTGGIVSAYVLRREAGIGQGFDFFDAEMPPSSPEVTIGQVQRDGAESEAIAEHWLDAQRSPRVFLFLHLYEPHKPYAPPDRFAEYAPYDGEIAYTDEIVGRLIHYLKTHQLYDRSTIVLLSDHGEGLGDHGEQEHGLFVYDEAIHVPLIVKQAGALGAGRRVADPVQHVDLVPTILDLVKAPVPGNLRGRSLKTLLDDGAALPKRTIYSEAAYGQRTFGWALLTSVADGRFQYVDAPRPELYDLSRDPAERTNILDGNADVAKSLRGALTSMVALAVPVAAPLDGAPAPADPKDTWPIAEAYRAADELASSGRLSEALAAFRQIASDHPDVAVVWRRLAALSMRAEHYAAAADAYNRALEIGPDDQELHLANATALLKLHKLESAREQAQQAVELAGKAQTALRADAHMLLAGIALAGRDLDEARQQARLVEQADPAVTGVLAYVEGRALYDAGDYAGAAPVFERALAAGPKDKARRSIPDLHYYAADTFQRLDRDAEAETELAAELQAFPFNTRARVALATLYHATDRGEESARALADLLRLTPTPEAYAQVARLWASFGDRKQAEAVRAEARRAFPNQPRTARRAGRR